jgi:hypothetical protein
LKCLWHVFRVPRLSRVTERAPPSRNQRRQAGELRPDCPDATPSGRAEPGPLIYRAPGLGGSCELLNLISSVGGRHTL